MKIHVINGDREGEGEGEGEYCWVDSRVMMIGCCCLFAFATRQQKMRPQHTMGSRPKNINPRMGNTMLMTGAVYVWYMCGMCVVCVIKMVLNVK